MRKKTNHIAFMFLGFSLLAALSAFGQVSKSKQLVRPRAVVNQRLSSLFARYAFSFVQNIDEMSSLSMKPIIDYDTSTSPFDIRRTAFERELDRVEQFDLATRGDINVHSMIFTAETLLFSHKVALDGGGEDKYGTRWIQCVQDIRAAITARAYKGDGACRIGKDE